MFHTKQKVCGDRAGERYHDKDYFLVSTGLTLADVS